MKRALRFFGNGLSLSLGEDALKIPGDAELRHEPVIDSRERNQELESHEHPELISTKQALAGAIAMMGTIGAVALAAGLALARLGGVEDQYAEVNSRARLWESSQRSLELQVTTLRNDIAWQTSVLQMMSNKMQLEIPNAKNIDR